MNKMQDEQISLQETDATQKVVEVAKEDISLGKFKDVNALLNAYNSLQSEFTKRCQRIKELEGALNEDKQEGEVKTQDDSVAPSVQGSVETDEKIDLSKEEYLKDYLKNLLKGKQKAVIMSDNGTSVKTLVEKPKTIAEAGLLAKEIF